MVMMLQQLYHILMFIIFIPTLKKAVWVAETEAIVCKNYFTIVHFVGVAINSIYAFEILVGKVKKRDLENEAVNEGTV